MTKFENVSKVEWFEQQQHQQKQQPHKQPQQQHSKKYEVYFS